LVGRWWWGGVSGDFLLVNWPTGDHHESMTVDVLHLFSYHQNQQNIEEEGGPDFSRGDRKDFSRGGEKRPVLSTKRWEGQIFLEGREKTSQSGDRLVLVSETTP
jgi:hypothetical protein